jgi:hypothetical protein
MSKRYMPMWSSPIAAAILAAGVLGAFSQPAGAQQPARPKLVALSSLIADGFEIRGVSSNQVGVASTLVLQKDKDVYLCASKDLSIQPTAFECWPVK